MYNNSIKQEIHYLIRNNQIADPAVIGSLHNNVTKSTHIGIKMPKKAAILESRPLNLYLNNPQSSEIVKNHHQMIMGKGINPQVEQQLLVLIDNSFINIVPTNERLKPLQKRVVKDENLNRITSFLKQNDLILTNYNSDEPIITKLDAEEKDSLDHSSSLNKYTRFFLTYVHQYCEEFNLDISEIATA